MLHSLKRRWRYYHTITFEFTGRAIYTHQVDSKFTEWQYCYLYCLTCWSRTWLLKTCKILYICTCTYVYEDYVMFLPGPHSVFGHLPLWESRLKPKQAPATSCRQTSLTVTRKPGLITSADLLVDSMIRNSNLFPFLELGIVPWQFFLRIHKLSDWIYQFCT